MDKGISFKKMQLEAKCSPIFIFLLFHLGPIEAIVCRVEVQRNGNGERRFKASVLTNIVDVIGIDILSHYLIRSLFPRKGITEAIIVAALELQQH